MLCKRGCRSAAGCEAPGEKEMPGKSRKRVVETCCALDEGQRRAHGNTGLQRRDKGSMEGGNKQASSHSQPQSGCIIEGAGVPGTGALAAPRRASRRPADAAAGKRRIAKRRRESARPGGRQRLRMLAPRCACEAGAARVGGVVPDGTRVDGSER